MLNLPTPPEACPWIVALGTATKALVLSVHTNKLWVFPGKLIAVTVLSVALSTTAIRALEGLTTRVRFLSGVRTIIPASGSAVESATPETDSTSVVAFTIWRAGKIPPVGSTWRGFETKARNAMPLGVRPLEEPQPHEIGRAQTKKNEASAITGF